MSNEALRSNLLSELEAVVGLCDEASAMMPSVEGNAAIREAETAATNWVITRHAEIAAAVRDARGERSESWEVWQDDEPVAGSDSFADALHYLMMYGQDGPVKLVRKVEYRETIEPEQIAAMSAREGE